MKIAIDISPLNDNRVLSHRVRGTGFYLQNLKKALLANYPDNEYHFFNRGDVINSDVDLVHYPYFEPFFLTLPFSKNHKTIVTVHDLTPLVFPEHFPPGIKGNIKWQIQKLNLLRSDGILTDSESSKKDISKYTDVKPEKIDVAYLAAGEEFTRIKNKELRIKETKNKYNLPEKFVLYVGDATWNKNLPRLLNAVKGINIPLVMVGKTLTEKNYDKSNPWNQDLLETQKLIEKSPNILTLGYVPTNDLVALYNTASVFIMPSLYEGFGLPILEAMQSGCPVITTKVGSLPEVAGDAA
ncbi:MAG TPA: glycosyltransferase family 1 protein, partial [Xanthomonadales bacterium]|nr:glycosyltransferase family 1 protein [Xanthomonadales bacterium]